MAFPWIYAVRIAQILFGLIVLALTAYGARPPSPSPALHPLTFSQVVSTFNGWSYSSTVDFNLFLGCWTTFLATPYLAAAPIYAPRLAHHYVIPAVEVVTMIFWFAGFVAMGAELPPAVGCTWSTCRALQAVTVFGSFEW
jgi:hypothetical protein